MTLLVKPVYTNKDAIMFKPSIKHDEKILETNHTQIGNENTPHQAIIHIIH